jgi:hypothetical protein
MNWWNDFMDWSASDHGWRLLSGAIIPFVAIVVAGIVAALIGRGATKRVVSMQEREAKNAAVAGVISAARKAATWGTLGHDERSYADHLAEDADIRLRLLPIPGAPVAANWAQHEIADIKRNSSTFSFQAEQSLADFRDRMLDWQARPARARKLFRSDLERWKFETPDPDAELVTKQQRWNADQIGGSRSTDSEATTSTTATTAAPVVPAAPATGAATAAAAPATSIATSSTPNESTSSVVGNTPRASGSESSSAGTGGASTGSTGAARPAWTTRSASSNEVDRSSSAGAPSTTTPTAPAPSGATGVGIVSGNTETEDRRDEPTAGELTDPKVDAANTTSTTSIPTRIANAPAEPADPDETNESPYASPVSASELRRRAAEDPDED